MGRIFEVRKASMFARWDKMAKNFTRIGKEIAQRKLKAELDKMLEDDRITKSGEKRWTKYSINKTQGNKP